MKTKCLALLGIFIISVNSYAVDKVIYGKDDRLEMYQFVGSPLAYLGNSVAAMIEKKNLKKSLIGDFMELSWKVRKLKDYYRFCGRENFDQQPTAAMCTGFLVHPKIIVTAGHCYASFRRNMCKHATWVFDYKVKRYRNSMKMEILPENIYRCKKVHKEIMDMRSGIDYAIVELDREVYDRRPVILNRKNIASRGDRLVIMGHPMGLPLKVASNARVIKNGETFFATNLDSFQGNSGSPVFNLRTGEVEGILVRGKSDLLINNNCYRINYCDDDGKNCDQNSEPPGEEVLAVKAFKDELDKVLRKL